MGTLHDCRNLRRFHNILDLLQGGFDDAAGKCTLNFYSGDELVTVEIVAHKLE